MPSRVLSIGVACVLAAVLTACGGSEPEPRVASVPNTAAATTAGPDPTSTATSASNKPISAMEHAQRFGRCMRDAGFELEVVLEDETTASEMERLRKLKTDPKFIAASKKCQESLPPMEAERPDPLTKKQLEAHRKYAACMREEGVPGFPDPDPVPTEPAPGDPQPPYGASDAVWQRAFNQCYGLVDPQFTPGTGKG